MYVLAEVQGIDWIKQNQILLSKNSFQKLSPKSWTFRESLLGQPHFKVKL